MRPETSHIILMANDLPQEHFASTFYRPEDGRRITLEAAENRSIVVSATHELCVFDKNALCYPYANTSKQKITIVAGPLQNPWQIEELQSLRELGWTIRYLHIATACNDEAKPLYNGRGVLEDDLDPEEKAILQKKSHSLRGRSGP